MAGQQKPSRLDVKNLYNHQNNMERISGRNVNTFNPDVISAIEVDPEIEEHDSEEFSSRREAYFTNWKTDDEKAKHSNLVKRYKASKKILRPKIGWKTIITIVSLSFSLILFLIGVYTFVAEIIKKGGTPTANDIVFYVMCAEIQVGLVIVVNYVHSGVSEMRRIAFEKLSEKNLYN